MRCPGGRRFARPVRRAFQRLPRQFGLPDDVLPGGGVKTRHRHRDLPAHAPRAGRSRFLLSAGSPRRGVANSPQPAPHDGDAGTRPGSTHHAGIQPDAQSARLARRARRHASAAGVVSLRADAQRSAPSSVNENSLWSFRGLEDERFVKQLAGAHPGQADDRRDDRDEKHAADLTSRGSSPKVRFLRG